MLACFFFCAQYSLIKINMKTPYCIADDNHVKEKFAYLCQQEHGMQVLERCVESQLYFLPTDSWYSVHLILYIFFEICSTVIACTYHICRFFRITKFPKGSKYVAFFLCVSHFYWDCDFIFG